MNEEQKSNIARQLAKDCASAVKNVLLDDPDFTDKEIFEVDVHEVAESVFNAVLDKLTKNKY